MPRHFSTVQNIVYTQYFGGVIIYFTLAQSTFPVLGVPHQRIKVLGTLSAATAQMGRSVYTTVYNTPQCSVVVLVIKRFPSLLLMMNDELIINKHNNGQPLPYRAPYPSCHGPQKHTTAILLGCGRPVHRSIYTTFIYTLF